MLLLLLLTVTVGVVGAAPALAQATVFHDNIDIPFEVVLASPCGESVHFTGAFHVETHTVDDANGGAHTQVTANDHKVSGVGVSSGLKYRRVGATVNSFNTNGSLPFEATFTNSFSFIGQGATNNTLLFETFHITVNANGELTAFC